MEEVYLALILSFGTYPIYIMAEDGVVDYALPDEWADDNELDKLLSKIQDTYESLFINSEHEFSYVGFKTSDEHNKFADDLITAIALIVKKNNGQYRIENRFDKEFMKHI